ncbi:MAG: hypothetical protein EBS41_08600 [Actinobacteria bacterium]|nr:hypothetical protein [Actinomycetota bacterium]
MAYSSLAYGFGLTVNADVVFGNIVGHSGGYPGYGTHMCWHPTSGIGVIALSNGRYGGAFRIATTMLRELLAHTNAPSKLIATTSTTRGAQGVVNALLHDWDDQALDAIVSANFDADIPRELRRESIESALALVGTLIKGVTQESGTAPSHLVWWRTGDTGRLRVEIRLTPQNPQRMQTLNVRAVPHPSQDLLNTAQKIVDGLWGAPSDVTYADAVDQSALRRMAQMAANLDGLATLSPLPSAATSESDATFEVRTHTLVWELSLALGEDRVVTKCALSMRPVTADSNVELV